jgi:hypothetical protein
MTEKVRELFRLVRMEILAVAAARYAGEEEFHIRRGCYPLVCADEDYDDGKVLCLYDNNPYQAGPEYRDRQLCRFRQRLDQKGYKEVGFGVWPPEGEESGGYSFALLIDDWSEEMQEEIKGIYEEEIDRTVREMPNS